MLRSRLLLTALALGLVTSLAALVPGPAGARETPIGQDPIVPGAAYSGDFPDPWVLRIGKRHYAYSTTSDRLNLPTLTSADLRRWHARPETSDAPRGDALPVLPAWAGSQGPWAPSVTRVARRHFVLAYSVEYGEGTRRMCISLATSTSPIGPFVDRSAGPTVCPARGAIDPQVFMAPNGRPWLVWKADRQPARLYTQPMNLRATRLLARPARFLAAVRQPWEGNIIENPAMIRFKKRFYLFYSANSYATSRYAIGYLICKSWTGPCMRPRKRPLLATGGRVAGPGGGAPFVDAQGRLRLAYHAWTAGAVGYPTSLACLETSAGCGQRRLYIATLKVVRKGPKKGRLQVVRRY